MTPTRLAGVGAFVIGGILLFAIGLFLIGERRMLFVRKIPVRTEFSRVSGLVAGSPVKVSGMPAGEVTSIEVPPGPGAKFRVRFRVRHDLHQLLRADSVASIQTEGLVGGNFLAVSGGTPEAPPVEPDGTIGSREPFEVADLLEEMSETVRLVNETIATLRGDVEKAIADIAETAERANALILEVGDDVEAIAAAGRRIAEDTRQVTAALREGRGTVGRLLHDDELYERAAGIAREAQAVIEQARRAVEEGRQTLAQFRAEDGPAQGMAADLRATLTHARQALANLEENTEALKRNWFFRGFFRSRGYFTLDAVSPAEYRRGVLEAGDRRTLRIWLQSAVLFATAGDGTDELTADGRARIDSAMATLLRYPLENPLVVEGYATGGSRDEQYLRSRARAELVRQYLFDRFELERNRTAVMPLGARAVGDSPAGTTWDGVALALIVDPAAVRRDDDMVTPGGGAAVSEGAADRAGAGAASRDTPPR